MISSIQFSLHNKPVFTFVVWTVLCSCLLSAASAFAKSQVILESNNARLLASEGEIVIKKSNKTLLQLNAFYFNYEKIDNWEIQGSDDTSITLHATLPASVDYYRTAFDNNTRELQITLTKVSGGFRFFAEPAWGRQVSMEFAWLGDHFFGLSEPLQPDNRLSPDLTGTSIIVDVLSEAASMRENYASAFSAFYLSSNGYGGFYDTFATGKYDFAINKLNRIYHETGKLDWYVFVGDNGSEIHKHYFSLIGKPKYVPLWGLGPVGWRDHNLSAREILSDIGRLTEMQIPFTAWFVDRPYSDGNHAWSKMNFSSPFANPEAWIKRIREDFGLEFMTWVATSTFGDPVFEKHLGGRYSYVDLSHPPTVSAYQKKLQKNQYAVGIRGHKIDRSDEVFAEHEEWFDGTPLPERRNKYSWLVAKTVHDGLADSWQQEQLTFARSAIHRTQPYLSAIWGGDPRTTWDGLQGNFANAMRASFMGFPVWGTDVGGYLGEGYIPEDLYLRWMQAGSMTGLFEIKFDGSGGDGRDRMPWRYDETFQKRFRAICNERMRFLPYLYSLANTSEVNGVLMKPMAYQHPDDKYAWPIWDQFYLGDALLVAPVLNASSKRKIYLPAGEWRNFDKPAEILKGGKTISVEADIETLPRYIRENSVYMLGHIYSGNSGQWRDREQHIEIYANPAAQQGSYTFDYFDHTDMQIKLIQINREKKEIQLHSPALGTQATVKIFMLKAPKAIKLNSVLTPVNFNTGEAAVEIPLPAGVIADIEITL